MVDDGSQRMLLDKQALHIFFASQRWQFGEAERGQCPWRPTAFGQKQTLAL
jgi:hypothetical protein